VFRSLLNASGRCAAPPGSQRMLPSLFGLAPCGVYPAPALTDGAVRSYRTISPLPQRESLPDGRTLPGTPAALRVANDRSGVAKAVSFLWHWPSTDLEARVPDVIRHTALRSSDFPPPASAEAGPAATARSSCQTPVYRHNAIESVPAADGSRNFSESHRKPLQSRTYSPRRFPDPLLRFPGCDPLDPRRTR
jgi:hypothetical protein